MSLSNPNRRRDFFLNNIGLSFQFKFEALEDYVNASLELSAKTNRALGKKVKSWDKKNPNHEYSGYDVYENEILASNNFEQKARVASIILTHSELEKSLIFLCDSIGEIDNQKIRLNDIYGRGKIEQCKNYLEKVYDVDFNNENQEWEELFAYNRLRNILTHGDGKINLPENQKLESNSDFKMLSKIMGLNIHNTGEIIIDELPIQEFIEVSKAMLDNICDKLNLDNP